MLSRIADVEGRVAFHSTTGGEYNLCFATNNTRWSGTPQKFVREALKGCSMQAQHLFPLPSSSALI